MMEHTIRIGRSYVRLTSEDGENWWIEDTFVPAEQRKMGIGKKLAESAFSYARSKGGKMIRTWAPDPGAFEFWKKMGFSSKGEKRL